MIYVPGYYGEVGVIAKQAKQLDIKAPLLGGDGWDSTQLWDLGGDVSERRLSFPTTIRLTIRHRQSKSLWLITKPATATSLTRWRALGYDAMKVLADAIKRAGHTPKVQN